MGRVHQPKPQMSNDRFRSRLQQEAPFQSENDVDTLAQLKQQLHEKNREIDLLQEEVSFQSKNDEDEDEDENADEEDDNNNHGNGNGNCDGDINGCDNVNLVTRSTQTSRTGSESRELRKKCRSLKRQLKAERATRDLISLVSLQALPAHQQHHQHQQHQQHQPPHHHHHHQQQQQQQQQLLQPAPSHFFTRQWEEKAEQNHYERTRKLLDAHESEMQRVKESHAEQIVLFEQELRKLKKKAKQYYVKSCQLSSVIKKYKTIVQESQEKALSVCETAFEELEQEQYRSKTLTRKVNVLEKEKQALGQHLHETTRLLDSTKQTLLQNTIHHDEERDRYNNVMTVLAHTATSMDIDATKDFRFSEMMTQPRT